MFDQIGDGYNGPFYLEVSPEEIAKDPGVGELLDELSSGTIINFERPHVTIWEFLDQGAAFKGVIVLQQKEVPFILTGKNDLIFIVKEA